MTRLFPERFEPSTWQGPRARRFRGRDDAFQQLVGDVLRETVQGQVHVMPTLSRDGSIDAFVFDGAALPARFGTMTGPVIVECKDNDDAASKDLRKNVEQSWRSVEDRLEKYASNGWSGQYSPWKNARGYLYLTSAVLGSEDLRSNLEKRIRDFFAALRSKGLSALDQVKVVPWSELRPILDSVPILRDHWLGIDTSNILPHAEYLIQLTGFRQYLLREHLPFIPPEHTSLAHPDYLFNNVIARANEGGILVTGPGGVGKTRTLFEVAEKASCMGWRVLHCEQELDTDELIKEVLQGTANTLLLFDYVDRMHNLDFGRIRRRLFPGAQQRRMQVAILASARTARETLRDEERSVFFQTVELHLGGAQVRTLLRTMQSHVARRATEQLGEARVQSLAGERPIIALLILREIERRVHKGMLSEADLREALSGDLMSWLRRRLREDALIVVPAASVWDESESPEAKLIAAAAVLMASPQQEHELNEIAIAACSRTPTVFDRAARAVPLLRELGWLEEHDTLLWPAHDVVVDEVLTQILRDGRAVRVGVLRQILLPGERSARTLGRLAVALRRLIYAGDNESNGFADALRNEAISWFEDVAIALGSMLVESEADASSYALGAILAGAPWEGVVERQWPVVAAPWLQRHGERRQARHLLYRGLHAGGRIGDRLIDPALRWIASHGRAEEASFVLAPLLKMEGLSESDMSTAIDGATRWLSIHGMATDAQFVLHALAETKDIRSETAIGIVDLALAWLETRRATLEAGFILRPLLRRSDLPRVTIERIVNVSLFWLGYHRIALDAGFVLRPLLARSDLSIEAATCSIADALVWLENYRNTAEAQFVLSVLLQRRDISSKCALHAINLALAWLNLHIENGDAEFILHVLLERRDLTSDAVSCAIDIALIWLDSHKLASGAGFVLPPLLRRSELPDDKAQVAINAALLWLGSHGDTVEAQFVLHALLGRGDLTGNDASCAVDAACLWLQVHEGERVAGYVLPPLLKRTELDNATALWTIHTALNWLRSHKTEGADFVLRALLERPDLPDESTEYAIEIALNWLDKECAVGDDFILRALLEQPNLRDNDAKVVGVAIRWLNEHAEAPEARFVLKPLLSRRKLEESQASQVLNIAAFWLSRNQERSDIDFIYNRLLRSRGTSPECAEIAIQSALRWLDRSTPDQYRYRDHTLNSLLARASWLDDATLQRIAEDACSWLERARPSAHACNALLRNLHAVEQRIPIGERVQSIADAAGYSSHAYRSSAEDFRIITAQIDSRARDATGLDVDFVRTAIGHVRYQVRKRSYVATGWAIPGLLSLAARTGDLSLLAEVIVLARKTLKRLAEPQWLSIHAACRQQLAEGPWLDAEEGARILAELERTRPLP